MPIPNYALVRTLAGVLFLLDLLAYLPYAEICLGAGYWGERGLHRRAVLPFVLVVWAAACASLILGFYPLVGAATLWLLFRHFYVDNRWKNAFRGGGAPGFMSHWTAFYLTLFELAALLDASTRLSTHVLVMYRVDLGVILLCSGTYKSLSGYLHGEGMEYGLANPFWGYWFKIFRRISPRNPFHRLQDIAAATLQLTMGACILIPPLRLVGALICIGGFLGLALVVRLGRLAILMAVVPILCLPDLGRWIHIPLPAVHTFSSVAAPSWLLAVLHALITTFIVLLPIVKGMQYLNLFGKRELPRPFQQLLTRYANRWPIIMWRVFTPDVTNFFIRIYDVDRHSGAATALLDEVGTYAYRELGRFRWSMRFLHVTESIALTTVFTTLKYFTSQRALFEERLINYAATLGRADDALLRFDYVAILKGESAFEYVTVGEFLVDLGARTVTEKRLVPDFDFSAPARHSHIKESTGFGSYAPKQRSTS